MNAKVTLADILKQTGQAEAFSDLDSLVDEFEKALSSLGVEVTKGGSLEAACLSVTDVLTKHRTPGIRNAQEDIRIVFTEVLGIWTFLTKVVRLHKHPSFGQFIPHLKLLNKGTVVQNKPLRACEETTNKIFELLFALVLLDVGTDLVLDDPGLAKGDNPDVLVTLSGRRWGFACKTVYGASGKTFFDNLKKGSEQIEVSEAEVGCVMVNFRNQLCHEVFWPILNEAEYRAGAEPVFGAYPDTTVLGRELQRQVTLKRDQVVAEIGLENVLNMFSGKKALPGFLAFCQTTAAKATVLGPVPTSISALVFGSFSRWETHLPVFQQINEALHERVR